MHSGDGEVSLKLVIFPVSFFVWPTAPALDSLRLMVTDWTVECSDSHRLYYGFP